MTITTYYSEGHVEANVLVKNIVKDLIGSGTPISGNTAPHMKVIFPDNYDVNVGPLGNSVVILEATDNIDPFSPPVAAISSTGYDAWRIAFHCDTWEARPPPKYNNDQITNSIDYANIHITSLAIYLGTSSTLAVDTTLNPPTANIAWRTTNRGVFKLPMLSGYDSSGDGRWLYKDGWFERDLIEPLGNTGAEWTNTFNPTKISDKQKATLGQPGPIPYESPADWDGPEVTDPNQLFVNKWYTQADSTTYFPSTNSYAAPLRSVPNSYRLVLSDHGMFLGVWGPDPEEAGSGFSWVLVQRPVDKEDGIVRGLDKATGLPFDGSQTDPVTGEPYPIGNRPLFCVNSVNGKFWKFIVREHDNPVPSIRKDATRNTRDSGAVINPYQQQSLTENGEYVITFLNNLNTSRFKYSDELDMVGTVSSDVVGGGSEIDVRVYNEEEKRRYHALWSSGSYGTKMRVMVVQNLPTPRNPAL